MEIFFSFIFFIMTLVACSSGVDAESAALFLLVLSSITIYELAIDSSIIFRVIMCLTYVRALLVLFMFFVSLVPERNCC